MLQKDRNNFQRLTRRKLEVVANLKFDFPIPKNLQLHAGKLRKELGVTSNFVVVAGSTRTGEEKIILNYFKALPIDNVVLVIVPRHPQRFNEVENLIKLSDLPYVRRSAVRNVNTKVKVILGDTMGDLYIYYGSFHLFGNLLILY